VLSVPAIQLDEPSCANGGPNRGTLLEIHHRLLERRYAGTRRPFAGIRQHGSTSWWIVPQADPCSHVLRGRPESALIFRFIFLGIVAIRTQPRESLITRKVRARSRRDSSRDQLAALVELRLELFRGQWNNGVTVVHWKRSMYRADLRLSHSSIPPISGLRAQAFNSPLAV
jgi:hypothetical protein